MKIFVLIIALVSFSLLSMAKVGLPFSKNCSQGFEQVNFTSQDSAAGKGKYSMIIEGGYHAGFEQLNFTNGSREKQEGYAYNFQIINGIKFSPVFFYRFGFRN